MTGNVLNRDEMPLRKKPQNLGKFTYDLLYPGVLGSMLFDLFDPLRMSTPTKFALLFIGLLFVADYLHLRFNLKADHAEEDSRPFIDAIIAIAYCFGYFALSATTNEEFDRSRYQTYEIASLIFIGTALVLATYYQFWYPMPIHRRLGLFCPCGICVIGLVFVSLMSVGPNDRILGIVPTHIAPVIAATGLASLFYGCYVLQYARPISIGHPKHRRWMRRCDRSLCVLCVAGFITWIVLALTVYHPLPSGTKSENDPNSSGPSRPSVGYLLPQPADSRTQVVSIGSVSDSHG